MTAGFVIGGWTLRYRLHDHTSHPRLPLPASHNGLCELAHLSFGTRDILGWGSRRREGDWGESSLKKRKTTVQFLEALWPQHSSFQRHSRQAQPHSRHNSLYSADAQHGHTELWRKDLTSTSGWGEQRKPSSACGDVLGKGARARISVPSFGWLLFLSLQDGNGKVSRVIRIGTRKSQVNDF